MKKGDLKAWAAEAKHGDAMTYHVGPCAQGDTCREAMALSEAGILALVRKRRPGSADFEYIAQRTRQKWSRK